MLTYGKENLFRQVKLTVCWFWLVILIVGVIAGITLISIASEHEAEEDYDEYESSVSAWKQTQRDNFSNLTITVHENSSKQIGPLLPIEEESSFDPGKFEEAEYFSVSSYEPLYYGIETEGSNVLEESSRIYDTDLDIYFNITVNQTILPLKAMKVFKQEKHTGITDKSCKATYMGYYDEINKECTVHYRLLGFCAILQDEYENWILDEKGCEGVDFELEVYELIDSATLEHHLSVEIELEEFVFTVRSDDDPYLHLIKVTDGELEFGFPSVKTIENQLMLTGIFVLIICLLLLIQPVLFIGRKCRICYRPLQNRELGRI